MDTVFEFLGRAEVQTVVIALVAGAFGLLKKIESVKAWQLTRALECLEAGVRATYEEYVRAVKEASMDGKLTDEERRQAMNLAISGAKNYAASEGVDLLKVYAKEYLPVLIEKIISRNKVAAAVPLALSAPELD